MNEDNTDCHLHIYILWNISYNVTDMNFKRYTIQVTMSKGPRVSSNPQTKPLGISPSDLASKSLGEKIENCQVTWRNYSKSPGLQDGWYKTGPASRSFAQPFIQAQIKENVKAPRHWPLWVEFTGDRWISITKGPVMWMMFPFDDVMML